VLLVHGKSRYNESNKSLSLYVLAREIGGVVN
jgi:hypothetical protein